MLDDGFVKFRADLMAGYDNRERLLGYWHSIEETLLQNAQSVLYVGCGTGFAPDYLAKRGLFVRTVDIDPKFGPDYVASVLCMPFERGEFDTVVCCEVLEHLPFEDFAPALREIRRVCGLGAVLSLPDASAFARVHAKIPHICDVAWLYSSPLTKNVSIPEYHCWEIGTKGYPLGMITPEMESAGFSLTKTYRVFEHPYQRFFVLAAREVER